MGGFSKAFWFWLPLLLFKATAALFRTIWKFNLWTLQSISGVPLYHCKPQYRIPGIFFGTLGLFNLIISGLSLLVIGSRAGHEVLQKEAPISDVLIVSGIALGLLFLCRALIRKGSL